jgi:type VI secretion system secreted protein VgrG
LLLILFIFGPTLFGTRSLNETELQLAEKIFASSVDFEEVRINEGGPLTWVYIGVTTGYTISFPRGEYDFNAPKDQALLMHELTHVWQYERIGISYMFRALWEEITQPDAYVVHYDPAMAFLDYDLEEQCEIVAEYFWGEFKYKIYIEELQSSARSK